MPSQGGVRKTKTWKTKIEDRRPKTQNPENEDLPETRCFREAYTGLPVVRVAENQKALNCVVLNYSIPVSEEKQIKEKRETLASGLTC